MARIITKEMGEQKHGQIDVFQLAGYNAGSATESGKPMPLSSVVAFNALGALFALN